MSEFISKTVLKIENLHKEFIQGSICVEILKDINLEIKEGELVAIIGSSGSGKSTLLQIAGLLDKASSGKIELDGVDISNLTAKQKEQMRLNYLGFVYQYHHLLRDFAARENILMPALIAGKSGSNLDEAADELLTKLGMFERRFNFPGQLSGGEQQRVAIARALFNKPKLLLADEPTGNLDPHTGGEVFKLFIELVRIQKLSTLIVTHNHELAAKADRVFELNDGVLKVV